MFENQPKGLYALALANTGERFGYYTMLAVFALFLRANYGLDAGWAGEIYSDFLMLVYFLPIVGGWLADRYGFGRMVTIGILIMFAGYLLLSVPLGGNTLALVVMLAALVLIGLGTGLFKGNLQVMVGDLYNDPKYAGQRDSGFSIFYMAINIGALFAPTAAVKIMEWAQQNLGTSVNDSYHFAFAVACASLILSIAIYYIFRGTFRHVEGGKKKEGVEAEAEELSKEDSIRTACRSLTSPMSLRPRRLQALRVWPSTYGILWPLSSLSMPCSHYFRARLVRERLSRPLLSVSPWPSSSCSMMQPQVRWWLFLHRSSSSSILSMWWL